MINKMDKMDKMEKLVISGTDKNLLKNLLVSWGIDEKKIVETDEDIDTGIQGVNFNIKMVKPAWELIIETDVDDYKRRGRNPESTYNIYNSEDEAMNALYSDFIRNHGCGDYLKVVERLFESEEFKTNIDTEIPELTDIIKKEKERQLIEYNENPEDDTVYSMDFFEIEEDIKEKCIPFVMKYIKNSNDNNIIDFFTKGYLNIDYFILDVNEYPEFINNDVYSYKLRKII